MTGIRRGATALVVALLTASVLATDATARRPSIAVSPAAVASGEAVRVQGRGWPAHARVRLAIGPPRSEAHPLGAVRADRRGRFTKRVVLRAAGRWVFVACVGRTCTLRATATVRVTARRTARAG